MEVFFVVVVELIILRNIKHETFFSNIFIFLSLSIVDIELICIICVICILIESYLDKYLWGPKGNFNLFPEMMGGSDVKPLESFTAGLLGVELGLAESWLFAIVGDKSCIGWACCLPFSMNGGAELIGA